MGHAEKGNLMSEAVQPAPPVAQEAEKSLADRILEAVGQFSPDEKQRLRENLDLGAAVTAPKSRGSNAEARRVAMSAGEIIHPPNADGTPFQPKVSEAVQASGGEDLFINRWNRAQGGHGASRTTTARDAEEMADLAEM